MGNDKGVRDAIAAIAAKHGFETGGSGAAYFFRKRLPDKHGSLRVHINRQTCSAPTVTWSFVKDGAVETSREVRVNRELFLPAPRGSLTFSPEVIDRLLAWATFAHVLTELHVAVSEAVQRAEENLADVRAELATIRAAQGVVS